MANNPKLALAVNAALNAESLRGAFALNGGLDAKRPNAWCEYGYPLALTFEDFFKLYKRHSLAFGVVKRLVDKCWETEPNLTEGEEDDDKQEKTPWEQDTANILRKAKFWKAFKEADKRRQVGKFSGILLQTRDSGARWDQPISGSPQLIKLIPAWQGQLKAKTVNTDKNSTDYGEVTMWSFRQLDISSDGVLDGTFDIDVHPDRIIILGDRDGEYWLEPGYNDFVDAEKIKGGSGESYLKNAARQLNVNFDKEVNLSDIARAHGVPLADLQEAFDAAAKAVNRGQDSIMITQGADVTPLVSTVPDPEKPFNVACQGIAAFSGIPMKVVVGMQTGERASTEDLRDFNKLGQGRRVTLLSDDIEQAIDHLIRVKVIKPVAEYTVVWDDLTESSQLEKLESAAKMADVNAKNLGTGNLVFTPEEIRDIAGFSNEAPAPLPELEPDEDDPTDVPPGDAANG